MREQEKTTKVEKRSLPTVTKQGNDRIVIPDFTGYSFGEVRQWLHEAGLAFIPDGTGYAVSQDIPAGTEVTDDETVRVVFSH